MKQNKWIILLTALLILSIEPASAIELGIETEPNYNNPYLTEDIENNPYKTLTEINPNMVESKTFVSVKSFPDVVESPSLTVHPSDRDIEGYHPASRADYSREVDASKPILVGVGIAAVITTILLVLYTGGGAEPGLPAIIERLARLGRALPPAPAGPAVGVGVVGPAAEAGMGVVKFVFTERELWEAATILFSIDMGAAALIEFNPHVIEKITEVINHISTDNHQRNVLIQQLGTNVFTVMNSLLLSPEARTQLFVGLTTDQQTQYLQSLTPDQFNPFLAQLANTLTITEPATAIHTLLNLVNQYHTDYAGQVLREMVNQGNGDYARRLVTEMVDRGYEQPIIEILQHMVNQGYMREMGIIFNSIKRWGDVIFDYVGSRRAAQIQVPLFVRLTPDQQAQLFQMVQEQDQLSVFLAQLAYTLPHMDSVTTLHIFRDLVDQHHSDYVEQLFTLMVNQSNGDYVGRVVTEMVDRGYEYIILEILKQMVNQGHMREIGILFNGVEKEQAVKLQVQLFRCMTGNQQVQLFPIFKIYGQSIRTQDLSIHNLNHFLEQLAETLAIIDSTIAVHMLLDLSDQHHAYCAGQVIVEMIRQGYVRQVAEILSNGVNQGHVDEAMELIVRVCQEGAYAQAGVLLTFMVNEGYLNQAKKIVTHMMTQPDTFSCDFLGRVVIAMDQVTIDKLSEDNTWLMILFTRSAADDRSFFFGYLWRLAKYGAIKQIETMLKLAYENNPEIIRHIIFDCWEDPKNCEERSELGAMALVLSLMVKNGGLDLVAWIMINGARFQIDFAAHLLKKIFKIDSDMFLRIINQMSDLGHRGVVHKLLRKINELWKVKTQKQFEEFRKK